MEHYGHEAVSASGLNAVQRSFFDGRSDNAQPINRPLADRHPNLTVRGWHLLLEGSACGILQLDLDLHGGEIATTLIAGRVAAMNLILLIYSASGRGAASLVINCELNAHLHGRSTACVANLSGADRTRGENRERDGSTQHGNHCQTFIVIVGRLHLGSA